MPQHGINDTPDLANAISNLDRAVQQLHRAVRPLNLRTEEGPVFSALREWRTQQAREKGLPPYIVATDAQLRAIEAARPTDLEQLKGVRGISPNKVDAYGSAILAVLAAAPAAEA